MATKKKSKVYLVGYAQSTRHLLPQDDPDAEYWTMNELYKHFQIKRVDRHFQLHPYFNFSRLANQNDPQHWEWLQQEHDFPIYMHQAYKEVPASIKYPLEEVISFIGRRYFRSTASYMLALAMYEGFKHIGLYGVDMRSDTEYWYQKANMEHLLGKAEGLGIHIEIPEQSSLLRGALYGYEQIMTGFRQQLEFRQHGISDAIVKARNTFHEAKGKMDALTELVKTYPELKEEFNKSVQNTKQTGAFTNTLLGAEQELLMIIATYDQFEMTGSVETTGVEINVKVQEA